MVLADDVEITDQYREEVERTILADLRWWSLAQIEASTATFVPRDLALLLPSILAGELPGRANRDLRLRTMPGARRGLSGWSASANA